MGKDYDADPRGKQGDDNQDSVPLGGKEYGSDHP
jgi:hypothetical protein